MVYFPGNPIKEEDYPKVAKVCKSGLISVIIPVYNVEKYLARCVDSLLSQTYGEIEIILVDDGSKDHSGSICDQYAQKDARIQVIHQQNKGLPGARNAGLRMAKGAYIGFVDSDDYIEKDMYRSLLTLLLDNDAEIAAGGVIRESSQGKETDRTASCRLAVFSPEDAISSALDANLYHSLGIYVWNKLYDASLFSRGLQFDESLVVGEDNLFMVSAFAMARKIVFSSDCFGYHYIANETSLTLQPFSRKRLKEIEANKKVHELLERRHFCSALRRNEALLLSMLVSNYEMASISGGDYSKDLFSLRVQIKDTRSGRLYDRLDVPSAVRIESWWIAHTKCMPGVFRFFAWCRSLISGSQSK